MATKRDRGTQRKQIAVVVYPGLTALELIGTVSALDGLGMKTAFETVAVGAHRAATATDTLLQVIPQGTFEDLPRPDGLLIPGGGINSILAMGDDQLFAYVRQAAATAEIVASVCSGALILAAIGLLEGRHTTTHWTYRRILENLGATYIHERWVEDGRFITSGGTSGGIDMALHLVAEHGDEATARQIQLDLDYDPQRPFGRLDYDAMGPSLRARRTVASHAAPLLTARARRMTRLNQ